MDGDGFDDPLMPSSGAYHQAGLINIFTNNCEHMVARFTVVVCASSSNAVESESQCDEDVH